jgi:RNA-directed DNA polymerase
LRDSLKNFIKEEKQMMISNEISASSDNEPWFLIHQVAIGAVLKL